MLYLESFIHRVELAEIVSRWLVNRPRPGDVRRLNEIVNFNSYIARTWVDCLAQALFTRLHDQPPQSFLAKSKGQLKDFIVAHPLDSGLRAKQLFAKYERFPEDFYRDTPYDGRVYYTDDGSDNCRCVGSTRIKRFRRIAEKGSRRIVDYLFARIRANADVLAEERARSLGIPKHQLITPSSLQVEEFLHAERRLLKMLRRGTIQEEFPILSIPDVVGIKVIAEGDQYERLVELLQNDPACRLLEQEHHAGRYNAINLRVSYSIPRRLLLNRPPNERQQRILSYRGFDEKTILERYTAFVQSAEDDVFLEIIVSNYLEFLESEIGRSMHEQRVLAQRSNDDYRGDLATNVMYLMDYLLSLCLSPSCEEIDDVPIKMWVKYMPDTMDRLQRKLFGMPVDASFDDVSELPAEPPQYKATTKPAESTQNARLWPAGESSVVSAGDPAANN